MAALGPIGDTNSSIERIVHRHRLRSAKRYVAGIKRAADRPASHTEAGNFAAAPESHQRFTPRSIPDIFAKRPNRHGYRVMNLQTPGKSNTRAPTGSVTGLCSASATMFAVGMAFLGYWGVYEQGRWHTIDYLVMVVAIIGFAVLGSVPWIVTTPVAEEDADKVVDARRAMALGTALIWMAVCIAVFA